MAVGLGNTLTCSNIDQGPEGPSVGLDVTQTKVTATLGVAHTNTLLKESMFTSFSHRKPCT